MKKKCLSNHSNNIYVYINIYCIIHSKQFILIFKITKKKKIYFIK